MIAIPTMDARELFETSLHVIDRAITRVCRNAGLRGPEAEDFASSVKIALLENDCAILRKHEGRSSLATYLTIVTRRLLVDLHRATGQRWYASAEAIRRGDAAILLERLLRRDGRSLAESLAVVQAEHPSLTVHEFEVIAAELPQRAPRPRLVAIADEDEGLASAAVADDLVDALDMRRRSEETSRIVRTAMAAMIAEDRLVLRLRFAKAMSVADIARALGIAQRPLYRRIESLLGDLKLALERAGVRPETVAGLIGSAGENLDFGFAAGKLDAAHPSMKTEGAPSGELRR